MSWDRCLAVAGGAALGGVARYLVAAQIASRWPTRLPLGTIVVNITGCFLIGALATWLTARAFHAQHVLRLFLLTGILGGYTTFSAFEMETWLLVSQHHRWTAFLNVAGSVLLGYAAVALGVWTASRNS